MRAIAASLVASILALASAEAAELPSRAAAPKEKPAKTCEVAGARGFLTEGGVCVKISGSVSGEVAAGSAGKSYVLAPQTKN